MFAQILVSALAFSAPAPKARASSSVTMAAKGGGFSPETQLGVIQPTGFWDPLGISAEVSEEKFDFYRQAELKHGRVAQLAVLGYIAPEVYRWPGEIAPGIKFADIPNGIAAVNAIPGLGWAQMFFLIGAVDYYGYLQFESGIPELSAAELEKRSLQELQHGRLAMLAFLELLRHDSQNLVQPGFDGLDHMITGLPFLYN